MRIAVIGKKNHLLWDRHVVEAFKELGHEVFHFQINDRSLLLDIIRNVGKAFYQKEISDKLMALKLRKILQSWEPDFIFFTSAFFIPIVYYEELHVLKVPIVAWDGDDGPSYERNKKYVSYIDILFECELAHVQKNFLGFKDIRYLPFAANLNIFKPLNYNKEAYMIFVGACSQRRKHIIFNIHYPLRVRGWGWDKVKKSKVDIDNKELNITQVVGEYNKALVALNIHQGEHREKGLNMRTFEVPACKTLLLCDDRAELKMHFEIDKEILSFETIQDLQAKIELLDDKNRIKQITEAGYKRVLQSHQYIHRMQDVIKALDK